ncbi:MAG: hypothetical protein N3F66_09785 [Spirochaetes bacterium]|nr:hypothetical protein [Spirochaetota bacterium]
MRIGTLSLILVVFVTLLIVFNISISPAQNTIVFLSPEFTKLVCEAWNKSELPQKLGTKETGGNGWILTENKYTGEVRNKQVLVMSRRDCDGMPKVQLTIENKNGKAVCTYGGALTEVYEKAEWAFAPTTVQWYKFASGIWGYMQMPGIMKGFRGPMFVARANIDNFGTFWKIVGRVAKETNADYKTNCNLTSDDIEDIEGYIKNIK